MSETTIRAALPEDINNMDRLLRELAKTLGEPEAYAGDAGALRDYGFGDRPVYHTRLAERDGTVVGLCVYFPEFSTWRCQPGLYVQDLFVDRHCRGTGIGQRLLAAAIRDAVDAWHAGYLRLAVHVINNDAREFYGAHGFTDDRDNLVMLLSGDAFRAMTEQYQ